MLDPLIKSALLISALLCLIGCGRTNYSHRNNPVDVTIYLDKEYFVKEMHDSPEYNSLPMVIAGYTLIIAIDVGLAFLKVSEGIPLPVTTEIHIRRDDSNKIIYLTWGENKIKIDKEDMGKGWSLNVHSPRLWNYRKSIEFDSGYSEHTYSLSIKNGLLTR